MAEIRINATGGVKLYDADDSHYAQIIAGTITSNVNAITLGHDTVTIADNLSLGSDSAVLKFGADGDTTLTHTDGTGLTLNSTNKLCFNDASQFIQGSSNAILALGATDEIDLTATAVDLNGTLDVSGTSLLTGRVGVVSAGDLGTGIHIKTADSGVSSIDASADELIIEGSGNSGMHILSGTSGVGGIIFGDSGDANIGMINYYHNGNSMRFYSNAGERFRLQSDGTSIFYQSAQSTRTLDVTSEHASFDSDMMMMYSYVSAADSWNFLTMRSNEDASPDTEFDFRGDGEAYADGSWNGSGADYAEFFESKTGSAIAKGTTLVLDGNKVRASTESDNASDIVGVARPKTMSKNSLVVGNTAWNMWTDKYLTNDFGEYEMEEYTLTQWDYREGVDDDHEKRKDPDTGKISFKTDYIPSDVTPPDSKTIVSEDGDGNKLKRRKLNPSWNKDNVYSPREDRDEWIIVGLIGQVQIIKGQKTGDRWIKMRDISETVEEWYIR